MRRKQWRTTVIALLAGLVAGVLVPSPFLIVGWVIWPGGVHSLDSELGGWARIVVIYGGGTLFWAIVVYALLTRRRRKATPP